MDDKEKTVHLDVRVSQETKNKFKIAVTKNNTNMMAVLREMIGDYIERVETGE